MFDPVKIEMPVAHFCIEYFFEYPVNSTTTVIPSNPKFFVLKSKEQLIMKNVFVHKIFHTYRHIQLCVSMIRTPLEPYSHL